jgi:hypothetical protein
VEQGFSNLLGNKEMTREILLSNGKSAVVSDEDYDYLSQWKWCARENSSGALYAARTKTFKDQSGRRKQKTIRMHREILARKLGHDDFEQVDHIDRNSLNNLRDNLRPVTPKQNCENRRTHKNNTSGARGVCWHKRSQKWLARICHNGKQIHLGCFDFRDDAEAAAIAARKQFFTHLQD